VGGFFDPEAFDPERFDDDLRELRLARFEDWPAMGLRAGGDREQRLESPGLAW
jgi:hypothetical protein